MPSATRWRWWTPRRFDAPSTKQAAEPLAGFADGGRALVVLADGEETCAKSFRNISGVSVRARRATSAWPTCIGAARLVLSQAALDQLTEAGVVNARAMIIRPVISEKSYALLAAGKYTFRVHERANKTQVRQAVEEIFGVRVRGVRTAVGQAQAQAARLHLRQAAAVEEGRRDAASRRTRSSCSRARRSHE